MSLGFMLQKKKGGGTDNNYGFSSAAKGSNSNPMLMMMAMMTGEGVPESNFKNSKLRRDLLVSGDQIGQIFSCMDWNLPNQTVSFWMCNDLFEQFRDYQFKMIRTDGWFCLPHSDVKLGDAKRIG
jgi:hypothetical protein